MSGSEFDPRRTPGLIYRYNEKQLNNYIAELNQFIDRRTQFVGASEGAPIPRADAQRFLHVQQRYNEYVERFRNEFKDIHIDYRGMTVEQWNKKMRSDDVFSKGNAAHKILSISESEIPNITGPVSLAKLQQQMIDKMNGSYVKEKTAQGREQMQMMLDEIGAPDLEAAVKGLSDFQFNVLWFEMDLADNVSGIYWMMTHASARMAAAVNEDKIRDVGKLISWARTSVKNPRRPEANPNTGEMEIIRGMMGNM